MSTAFYNVSIPPLERPAVFVVGFPVSEAIQTKYAGRVKFNLSPVKSITKPHHLPIGVTGVYAYTFTNSELQALRAICNSTNPPASCCAFTSENQLLRYLAEQFGEPIPSEEVVPEYAADIPSASEGPRPAPPLNGIGGKASTRDDVDFEDDPEDPDADDELGPEPGAEFTTGRRGRPRTNPPPNPNKKKRKPLVYDIIPPKDDQDAMRRLRELNCDPGSKSEWARNRMTYPCAPSVEAAKLLSAINKEFPKSPTSQGTLYFAIRDLMIRAKLPMLKAKMGGASHRRW